MKKGIDISYYQEKVDFEKLSKNVDFVIFREGYRKAIDSKFVEYVEGARKNGIDIHGVYHFIYATDNISARDEALSAIANVEMVGLPKTTRIWADMEYDSIKKAKKKGINLGRNEINLFTQTFCETIREFGYQTGIYCNIDWYKNYYKPEVIAKYPVWLADLNGEPDFDCLMQQYTFSGKADGVNTVVDMDYCWCMDCEHTEEKEQKVYSRQEIINLARQWVGRNEADGSHKTIIDIYNSRTPRARGYKVQYTDQWCATTISALAIALGYEEIIPIECGCPQMIKLAQDMGIWMEDDSYVPQMGDILLYDWQDSANYKITDNKGVADHIGIVESVDKASGVMVIIEGNYADSVKRRKMEINGKYIRGFITPKYTVKVEEKVPEEKPVATVIVDMPFGILRDAQTHLNNFVGASLDIDGEIGAKTLTAMRKAIQIGLNMDFNACLEVDGVIGVKSKTAMKKVVLKNGAKGYLVTALEICLMARGYEVYGVENPGLFGDGLENAVRKFQSDNGLEVDGECGFNTFSKLLQ